MNLAEWSAVAAEVTGGIAEAGQQCYILRQGRNWGSGYEPDYSPDEVVPYACKAMPVWKQETPQPGTLVTGSLLTFLVAADGLEVVPDTSDRIQDANGAEYQIKEVQTLAPGGVVVLWKLKVGN